MDVKFNELKANVKLLNEACGTNIKTVAVKAEVLLKNFQDALGNGLDNVPEDVLAYGQSISDAAPTVEVPKEAAEEVAEEATEEAAEAPTEEATEEAGEEVEIQRDYIVHLDALGLDASDYDSQESTEEAMLGALNMLSDDDWKALPAVVKAWDDEMDKKAKAAEASVEAAEAAPPKPTGKAKIKVAKPRPGFTYKEGTSARKIMDEFRKIAKGGKGVEHAQLLKAAENAGIKSNNLSTRVRTTLTYAKRPEGGEQVVKIKNLYYITSEVPEHADE